MAYFARINEQNIVEEVLAVSDDNAPDPAPNDTAGNQFLHSLGLSGRWIQTSFNNNIRKQFAGIGYTYNETADVFITPQPFPSWSLDDNFDWQAPTPAPAEEGFFWDEDGQTWVAVEQPA